MVMLEVKTLPRNVNLCYETNKKTCQTQLLENLNGKNYYCPKKLDGKNHCHPRILTHHKKCGEVEISFHSNSEFWSGMTYESTCSDALENIRGRRKKMVPTIIVNESSF